MNSNALNRLLGEKKVMENNEIFKNVDESVANITQILLEREKRQDEILPLVRQIIRECSIAIRFFHQKDFDNANKTIEQIKPKIMKLNSIAKDDLMNTAISAQVEFVEAVSLVNICTKQNVPTYQELDVDPLAYLDGLCDCAGELRRQIQIAIKDNDKEFAQYCFDSLEKIYSDMMVLKFSSSLVGSLKRKQDVLRMQLEQARSEMLRFS